MNKKISIVACGLLALSLTGCQKNDVSEAPPEASEIEIENPVVEYKTSEELASIAGFDLSSYEEIASVIADAVADGAKVSYSMVSSEIAQVKIDYPSGTSVVARASKTVEGIEELAGIYTTVEGVDKGDGTMDYEITSEDGSTITKVITHSENGINFSVVITVPMTEQSTVNPVVDYASAEELARAVGYDITSYDFISEPLSQVQNAKIHYQTVDSEITQIRVDYESGAYVEFRASKTHEGIEDLACVYGSGEGVPTSEEENAPLKYTLGAMEVLTLAQDGINFSILNAVPNE